MAQRYHFDAAEVGMNRRRKEVASKSEIKFRLAKLNWYLRRLVEWAKLTVRWQRSSTSMRRTP
jgi:hypothetical protein